MARILHCNYMVVSATVFALKRRWKAMARRMKKALRVPGGKLGAKTKRGISRPGSRSGEDWAEMADSSWGDWTGQWMDFSGRRAPGTKISNPARSLKRNIKKR